MNWWWLLLIARGQRLARHPRGCLVLLIALIAAHGATAADEITLNGVTIQSSQTAIILQPGDSLEIGYQSRNMQDRLKAAADEGTLVAIGTETWLFQPPSGRWRSIVKLVTPHRKLSAKV
ncbi:MAG: hypothetical protein AAGG11_13775, partial [Pseudomonadota bacterium]